jgi:hypothetical protein
VADRAGGIFVGGYTALVLTDSTVKDNSATAGSGGGINNSGSATITGSTISGNTATADGGGIWTSPFFGALTLTSSTVSGNSAAGEGGGIAVGGTTGTFSAGLFNSTVAFNTADSDGDGAGGGGGIANGGPAADLKDTIIARNADLGSPFAPDCAGELNSQGNNLIQDPTCPISGDTAGLITAQDPLLGPLAGNGGPTQTHALLPGSPAIDAGSSDCPPPATDQRRVARPQGPACDLGAFEAAPSGTPPKWGDDNCSGAADPVDSLITLSHAAGLSTSTGDCPGMAEVVDVAGFSPHVWGDVDCEGAVNAIDALRILRFVAHLSLTPIAGCPDVGVEVSVSPG